MSWTVLFIKLFLTLATRTTDDLFMGCCDWKVFISVSEDWVHLSTVPFHLPSLKEATLLGEPWIQLHIRQHYMGRKSILTRTGNVWNGACSRCWWLQPKIVGFFTLPRKNPITIYDTILRPLLLSEGIWDQLRSDHGTEFFTCSYNSKSPSITLYSPTATSYTLNNIQTKSQSWKDLAGSELTQSR